MLQPLETISLVSGYLGSCSTDSPSYIWSGSQSQPVQASYNPSQVYVIWYLFTGCTPDTLVPSLSLSEAIWLPWGGPCSEPEVGFKLLQELSNILQLMNHNGSLWQLSGCPLACDSLKIHPKESQACDILWTHMLNISCLPLILDPLKEGYIDELLATHQNIIHIYSKQSHRLMLQPSCH